MCLQIFPHVDCMLENPSLQCDEVLHVEGESEYRGTDVDV